MGCTKPPILSASVVRELGTTFCKLPAENLADEQLLAKPGKKDDLGAVGKAKAKKPPKNKDATAKGKSSRKNSKKEAAEEDAVAEPEPKLKKGKK